jgi:mRNA turnover protein 4
VCKEGQALDSNQVALLRVFDIKMATFRLRLLARWSSESEEVEQLAEPADAAAGEEEDEEGEDMEGDVPDFTFPEADGAVMLPAHLK